MGPSEDVQHGHVVRFPDGTFVTSLHLKQNLVDADGLVDLVPREVEIPLPERRVRGKRRLAKLFQAHPLIRLRRSRQRRWRRSSLPVNVGTWRVS